MIHLSLLPLKSIPAFFTAVALTATVSTSTAQQAATTTTTPTVAVASEPSFSFELGKSVVDRPGGASTVYTVAATTDFASKQKGSKVRLMVVEKDGTGTMTHLLTVNTGKYKTSGDLAGILAGIFRKYLDVAPANQEIGKIGDIDHGGEIRFFAESRETIRYDWLTQGEPPHSTQFKRNDIQAFLGILTHSKAVQ